MIHNDKTKKIIVFFAAADVVLALVYGVLFFNVNKKNAETAITYSTVYRRTSDETAFIRNKKTLADTEQQRSLLDAYVVTPEKSLSFIEQIENLGKITFTEVQVISLSNPKKAGDLFSLDFTAEGKFENVFRLFSLIEEMPFRLSLKRASMTANTQDETWKGSFTIVLYSYRM